MVRWGPIPTWAKDPGIGHKLINGRAETDAVKPCVPCGVLEAPMPHPGGRVLRVAAGGFGPPALAHRPARRRTDGVRRTLGGLASARGRDASRLAGRASPGRCRGDLHHPHHGGERDYARAASPDAGDLAGGGVRALAYRRRVGSRHARGVYASGRPKRSAPAATVEPGDVLRPVGPKRPALVALDLAMPGADGIGPMQTLPIIFVSACGGGARRWVRAPARRAVVCFEAACVTLEMRCTGASVVPLPNPGIALGHLPDSSIVAGVPDGCSRSIRPDSATGPW